MLAVVMIGAPIAIWLAARILFAPPRRARPRPLPLLPALEAGMLTGDDVRQLEAATPPTLVADLPGLVLAQFQQTLDEIQTLPEIQREELLS